MAVSAFENKTDPFLECEVKLLTDQPDGSPGGFTAYVAVFGNVDRAKEVIVEGAFVNLDMFIKAGWSSFSHFGTTFPVATVKSAVQDATGLLVEFEFHTTTEAQEARKIITERLARGKAVGCSIYYRVLEDEWKDGIRYLKRLEVWEAGAVTLPCNPQAGALAAKSHAAIDQTTTPNRGKRLTEIALGQIERRRGGGN